MKTKLVEIALLFAFTDGVAWATSPSVPARNSLAQAKCNPIGRIMNDGDRYWKTGSLLCKGDRLEPVKGKSVQVLCYLTRQVLYLKVGVASELEQKCALPATTPMPCSIENHSNCLQPKGPIAASGVPSVISPYGSEIATVRPLLAWHSVAGATSYTVRVEGRGVAWEKSIDAATLRLTYPTDKPQLIFGNAYKITAIANKGKAPFKADSSVVNVLPENTIKRVFDVVRKIESLNLPSDEAALLDLDAIYMSENLLDESIKALEKVSKTTSNPSVKRMLGDRYLEAGLIREAIYSYEATLKLANKKKDREELSKAKKGIETAIFYSQLPKSRNPDQ
ncbi:MAG: hypothetical protein CLLPBCKN_007234 [Chroococcidiopsis cubana SAG 39.79]|uniref:tetratricopeptide repeat protein n=1 Tax=Chroococcidiopsis cubana TaxID=171392 RepID=UPI000D05046E|nr:hypothetical protein [Chroococcidiopsis cubana]MDZ4877799.1 hypothetical protein [Chroococcidiopsis cubana SAG 39.79]PSB66631.1 hypothetical protein C7B79_00240 [Chroococcidiopsis cubana CCALA 043]PSB66636.1 hypothetical protein C7B79_00265 [Chroococcidiopsis cubana CCALA 043]